MNKTNTIVINEVFRVSTDELNSEIENDILGEENADLAYEKDGINTICKQSFQTPMNIKYLKKLINNAESKNCNYLSFDYNCDHNEYEICGFDIHSATDSEIDIEVNRIKDENKKKVEKELDRLDRERQRLLNSIK